MKTSSIAKLTFSVITGILILLSSFVSRSQYVITFKDRTEVTAYITYQTKDTVKYVLKSSPNVTYVELMKNIYSIKTYESSPNYLSDSLKDNPDYQKYLRYKRVTNSGVVLMPIGAIICGIGIAGMISTQGDEDLSNPDSFAGPFFSALAIGLGGGLFLTGAIKAIAGSTKMQQYKAKLHGFSFDLKYTPNVKGISLTYRF
jgi:hypothetical protein